MAVEEPRDGLRLGAAGLPAVAGRADRRRADRRHRRADPAAVRDAVAPRRRPAARHRARRTPVHQPQARGVGRAADAVRRPHQPRPGRPRDDLGDLQPRRDRAADPEVDPVRRGARRRPLDPQHDPQAPRCRRLSGCRGQPPQAERARPPRVASMAPGTTRVRYATARRRSGGACAGHAGRGRSAAPESLLGGGAAPGRSPQQAAAGRRLDRRAGPADAGPARARTSGPDRARFQAADATRGPAGRGLPRPPGRQRRGAPGGLRHVGQRVWLVGGGAASYAAPIPCPAASPTTSTRAPTRSTPSPSRPGRSTTPGR